MLILESRRKSLTTLKAKYPQARIVDVTSRAPDEYVKFSPFYPHGGIPVPFSQPATSMSVEGIWQGLKVFETAGIDPSKFRVENMKGLKRTVRKFGKPLGHQKGLGNQELLGYIAARKAIFLPAYLWILENKLADLVKILRFESRHRDVVLLDFETNADIHDPRRPLSHAGLIKRFLEQGPESFRIFHL